MQPTHEPLDPGAPVHSPDGALAKPAPISPLLIILQWLTYAFWGWTVLGSSVLIVDSIYDIVAKSDSGAGFVPYGLAIVLVLLPISIICDVF